MADPLPPGRLQLPQGWYVQLSGEKFDLEDWEYTLNEPFDPVVMQEPDGTFLLKSREFDEARTADEVREKALGLINRLNGALALMHGTRPVTLAGVIGVDDQGRRHISVTMTGVGLAIGRARMRATATVLGPDGLPLPPPPPQPSDAQRWNQLASTSDDIADLLEQHGKAEDWYEMYKAIELAERIAGGEHKLKRLLGSSSAECKNFKQTANFYRHSRAPRPTRLTTLGEGKTLLNYMVRQAIEAASSRS